MKAQVFIIIGKSGSGKGTQAELLVNYIKQKGHDVHHLEMGGAFRDFLRESNYTAVQSKDIANRGDLQPDFLANYFYTEEFIKYFNGERNFILDGTPRTKRQARILDGTLRFYGVISPMVIHLNISDDSVITRMQERSRGDDQIEAIKTRLSWFQEDTVRALEFFQKHNDYYRYIELNGEGTVEDIHEQLMKQINYDE